ncbi:hypothetical protein KSP39_PZI004857 [Platanthera zijinensis]|uniref:Uncharacterized protein n=1 Tax=Platanthera zijinensis TaxID=2320716 RepID=A0AAP0BXF7_9ASPA
MLLRPSNSASHLLISLPIEYDSIRNLFPFCYTCSSSSSSSCSYLPISFYANGHCPCGKLVNKKLEFVADAPPSSIAYSGVLILQLNSLESAVQQISKLDIKQLSCLESVNVDITVEEVSSNRLTGENKSSQTEPKSHRSKTWLKDDPSTGGGYLRISKYMISDNLVIRQPSSHIVITGILRRDDAGKEIHSLKGGIHAKIVEIGEQKHICFDLLF